MKRIVFLIILSTLIEISEAALPPDYRNELDLDVMVQYIKDHPVVAEGLKWISLKNHTIYFNDCCKVIFGRQETNLPDDYVGPVPPLEFKNTTCPVD
ncbi:MAG: hypothetical protein P8179_16730 [Candidatus Thiodiazotropha sp.]|jgi:hypothetical protein